MVQALSSTSVQSCCRCRCCRNTFQVFGHNPYRQHVTARDGHITDKAAQVLGVILPSSEGRGGTAGGSRAGGNYRRPGVGRGSHGGPRSMVEEEVRSAVNTWNCAARPWSEGVFYARVTVAHRIPNRPRWTVSEPSVSCLLVCTQDSCARYAIPAAHERRPTRFFRGDFRQRRPATA